MANNEGRPGFTQAVLSVAAILALLWGVATLVLSLDKAPTPSQAEFIAAHEQFTHPLPCDVRVSDGMTSVTMTRPRCYMTKATRGSK